MELIEKLGASVPAGEGTGFLAGRLVALGIGEARSVAVFSTYPGDQNYIRACLCGDDDFDEEELEVLAPGGLGVIVVDVRRPSWGVHFLKAYDPEAA